MLENALFGKIWQVLKNWLKWTWENAHYFLPKTKKVFMKEPSCKWMINALHHWLNFSKKYLVKNNLAFQKNISTYFAPKYGLNGLRKIPSISHQWGTKLFWKHNLAGGWFMHLTIGSFLEKSIRLRKYWFTKTTTQPILHISRKCPRW